MDRLKNLINKPAAACNLEFDISSTQVDIITKDRAAS